MIKTHIVMFFWTSNKWQHYRIAWWKFSHICRQGGVSGGSGASQRGPCRKRAQDERRQESIRKTTKVSSRCLCVRSLGCAGRFAAPPQGARARIPPGVGRGVAGGGCCCTAWSRQLLAGGRPVVTVRHRSISLSDTHSSLSHSDRRATPVWIVGRRRHGRPNARSPLLSGGSSPCTTGWVPFSMRNFLQTRCERMMYFGRLTSLENLNICQNQDFSVQNYNLAWWLIIFEHLACELVHRHVTGWKNTSFHMFELI